ncbi:MAG TPA: nuclear transport factor 2 family protein [Solirubrobacterales bacterium]|nr:nuclear transport factor 2 family protein [Solirubrobacterales bacterium]
MSEQAVEVVRRSFEDASRVKDPSGRVVDALDRETLAVAFDFFDPEIEIREDPRFPERGVYRGLQAVGRYFAQFTENFDEFTFEAEDFVDLGDDRVLVLFRLRTRGAESGARAEARPGWIYTIRGGKAVRIEAYLDRREALAAAGLAD